MTAAALTGGRLVRLKEFVRLKG
eukprot:COSAG02_NODE_38944_length_423_cov_0.543210_1_plen_22_part_10